MTRRVILALVLTACGSGDGTGPRSPAPMILFVSAHADSVNEQLYLQELDGSSPRPITSGSATHELPAVSPDGRQVLFLNFGGGPEPAGLYLTDIDGSNPRRSEMGFGYVWSPLGTRVASLAGNSDTNLLATALIITNADGTGRVDVVADNNQNLFPTWAPDGTRLAYQKLRADVTMPPQIWVVNADGTDDHAIVADSAWSQAPSWSPDGRWIAFVGELRSDASNLRLVAPDGGERRDLPGRCEDAVQPRWSPDGTRIACIRQAASPTGYRELVVVDVDGSGASTPLFPTPTLRWLSWSPDGRSLLFEGVGDHGTDAMLLELDGAKLRNLTHDPRSAYQPLWVPRQ